MFMNILVVNEICIIYTYSIFQQNIVLGVFNLYYIFSFIYKYILYFYYIFFIYEKYIIIH